MKNPPKIFSKINTAIPLPCHPKVLIKLNRLCDSGATASRDITRLATMDPALNRFVRLETKTHPPTVARCAQLSDSGARKVVGLSDMVRFHVLHRYGGIYVDADVLFVRDMSELCGSSFPYYWGELSAPNTAVFGADAERTFLTRYMDFVQSRGLQSSRALIIPCLELETITRKRWISPTVSRFYTLMRLTRRGWPSKSGASCRKTVLWLCP